MLFNPLVVRAQNAWYAFRNQEDGQTLIEYALIISLIGIASIAALIALQGKIGDIFDRAGSSLDNAPATTTTP